MGLCCLSTLLNFLSQCVAVNLFVMIKDDYLKVLFLYLCHHFSHYLVRFIYDNQDSCIFLIKKMPDLLGDTKSECILFEHTHPLREVTSILQVLLSLMR